MRFLSTFSFLLLSCLPPPPPFIFYFISVVSLLLDISFPTVIMRKIVNRGFIFFNKDSFPHDLTFIILQNFHLILSLITMKEKSRTTFLPLYTLLLY